MVAKKSMTKEEAERIITKHLSPCGEGKEYMARSKAKTFAKLYSGSRGEHQYWLAFRPILKSLVLGPRPECLECRGPAECPGCNWYGKMLTVFQVEKALRKLAAL